MAAGLSHSSLTTGMWCCPIFFYRFMDKYKYFWIYNMSPFTGYMVDIIYHYQQSECYW